MPSLTPLGDKIKSFRSALGLTQLELSLIAGVSERTLRTAEKNQPVRQSYLEAIAGALKVPLPEIAEQSRELGDLLNWQRNVGTFVQVVLKSMGDQDAAPIVEYAHNAFQMNYVGSVPRVDTIQALLGQYQGADGVRQFIDNAARFWEKKPGDVFTLDAPAGMGNLVVLRGRHQLNTQDGDTTWGRFTYVAEFDGGRLANLDAMMVPCDPPDPMPLLATESLRNP